MSEYWIDWFTYLLPLKNIFYFRPSFDLWKFAQYNKPFTILYTFLFNLLSWSMLTFYSIHFIMYIHPQVGLWNVLKIFQMIMMKNEEFFLKWKDYYQNCSWKRSFCFNKRAPLFNKRALGQARRTNRGRILPNQELLVTFLIQIKKTSFSGKWHFLTKSNPWMLFLP